MNRNSETYVRDLAMAVALFVGFLFIADKLDPSPGICHSGELDWSKPKPKRSVYFMPKCFGGAFDTYAEFPFSEESEDTTQRRLAISAAEALQRRGENRPTYFVSAPAR